MNWIEDYSRSGGWAGQATRTLKKELSSALKNKKDILHGVASEYAAGKSEQAFKKLIAILFKHPQKLSKSTQTFLHALLSQSSIEFAEQNIDNDDVLKRLPIQAVKYAAIGVGLREAKAAGGRKKGKKWQEVVISAWEASDKKQSVPQFATNFFRKNGGKYDEDGNKQGKIPSERTIANYIRAHKKKKKPTAF